MDSISNFLGKRINNTRIIPITLKITAVFTVFLVISNLITNYINITFNRVEMTNLMKELLVKDLKELYNYANIQHEIFDFNHDYNASIENIRKKGLSQFKNHKSINLGISKDGTIVFKSTGDAIINPSNTLKHATIASLNNRLALNKTEDALTFSYNHEKYIGVYKYNVAWDMFLVRGEELKEFYGRTWIIFRNISFIIIIIAAICAIVGIFILSYILRFLDHITKSIINMTYSQKMDIIDMRGATNDDVTFLGTAFNSLSSNINNLMSIFLKFVNRDTALKAYKEKMIRLEGTPKELTILFSDIKSFTFMTETLGIDIIKLLNLHYEQAINKILVNEGIIGSIIGDALLAVFGAFDELSSNKSYNAIMAAYQIQEVAASLREKIIERKDSIIESRGYFTEEEKKIFKAVLLEVGVGIDGGTVFYGNIGSTERMTNTVIGDNVNSASRLEGLTRIYKVPVICSEYIRDDIINSDKSNALYFQEIDTVQVKGKTFGKKIYWPIRTEKLTNQLQEQLAKFNKALAFYYEGNWESATELFDNIELTLTEIFKERIRNKKAPQDWDGIWTMTTK